jgi:hypothetical protein
MPTSRQKLLLRMGVALANVEYFEKLHARLMAGATSGTEVGANESRLDESAQAGRDRVDHPERSAGEWI